MRLTVVNALPAVDDGHDDIMFEVIARIIGPCIVRLLRFVIRAGIEHITLFLPGEEKDGSKVGKERPEIELFKDEFLLVHIVSW